MNEKQKHSPGPWKLNHRGDEVMVAEGPNVGLTLAKVTQFVPEFRAKSDANARLMAAAPDLLAALRQLRRVTLATVTDSQDKIDVVRAADAALSRAEQPS